MNSAYALAILASISFKVIAQIPCPIHESPGVGLEGYLTAMQRHRFENAYEFVTTNMTDGKSMEDWVKQQQYFYIGGEVVIFAMSIRDAIAVRGVEDCKAQAIVPNVLKSRDKFNNQGTTEFELYKMVKEGDAWKVDSLEVLFEEAEIAKWFPEDRIPEFQNQHP